MYHPAHIPSSPVLIFVPCLTPCYAAQSLFPMLLPNPHYSCSYLIPEPCITAWSPPLCVAAWSLPPVVLTKSQPSASLPNPLPPCHYLTSTPTLQPDPCHPLCYLTNSPLSLLILVPHVPTWSSSPVSLLEPCVPTQSPSSCCHSVPFSVLVFDLCPPCCYLISIPYDATLIPVPPCGYLIPVPLVSLNDPRP